MCPDQRMLPDLVQRRERSDREAVATQGDLAKALQPAEVNDPAWAGDAEPEPVEQLGPPAMDMTVVPSAANVSSMVLATE